MMHWRDIAPTTFALELPNGVIIRSWVTAGVGMTFVPDVRLEEDKRADSRQSRTYTVVAGSRVMSNER